MKALSCTSCCTSGSEWSTGAATCAQAGQGQGPSGKRAGQARPGPSRQQGRRRHRRRRHPTCSSVSAARGVAGVLLAAPAPSSRSRLTILALPGCSGRLLSARNTEGGGWRPCACMLNFCAVGCAARQRGVTKRRAKHAWPISGRAVGAQGECVGAAQRSGSLPENFWLHGGRGGKHKRHAMTRHTNNLWAGGFPYPSASLLSAVGIASSSKMDSSVLETEFLVAQEAVGRQGDVVRSLKAQLKDGKVERVSLRR